MKKISFKYWTNLCYNLGTCYSGECTVEMNDEELKLFQIYTRAINDKAKSVIEYLCTLMPKSLIESIDEAIYFDVVYNSAKHDIKVHGIDCFEDMSWEEFNSLTTEELIERCIEENADGVYEYEVTKYEILDPQAKHIISHSPTAKTMYVIDNGKNLSMARCVPEIVKIFLNDNPKTTYAELKRLFHDDLTRKSHRQLGVLCTKEEFAKWNTTTKDERYHIAEGALVSGDGVEFYVNNQWSRDVFSDNILPLAKKIGFEINL